MTGEKRDCADAETASAGVLDLLGMMAYAQLVAFFELTDDAASAISLADKAALAEMAVAEFGHFQLLRRRIVELHADPEAVMQPFVAAVDAFHARTAPSDWLESLIKAYVGDGIAADFYEAVARLLDARTQALVLEVLSGSGRSAFVIERIRAAIDADPRVAGRLALWARRLVGEASAQAQRVAAQRAPLARLLAGGPDSERESEDAPGERSQPGDIGRMFARLADAHTARMAKLGLTDLPAAGRSDRPDLS